MGTICFTEINFKIFGDKIHVKRANYKIAICSIAFLVTFSHLRKFILVWWSFKEVWWSIGITVVSLPLNPSRFLIAARRGRGLPAHSVV